MAILAFAEPRDKKFPKATQEVVSYTAQLAAQHGTTAVAVFTGEVAEGEVDVLYRYGADQVVQLTDAALSQFNNQAYAKALQAVAQAKEADVLVFPGTFNSRTLAARLAARLDARAATDVLTLPNAEEGFAVKRGVYSGKGYEWVSLEGPYKVLTVATNGFGRKENPKQGSFETMEAGVGADDFNTEVREVHQSSGEVSLPESERVVSGGRGMKGPENWHLLTQLAEEINASLACSKPVSDMEWRPHSEHVGQTGITISPNLYVAVGISGAVQHLAGVSSSRVIVAINKDPEAPIFKSADYGIIGDAFEVVPKLIEALKKTKAHA
jgi:electron transfer flavoprotein alpha subunit